MFEKLINKSDNLMNLRLINLRNAFRSEGYEMWFVGGCVRDLAFGVDPKDVDIATSATPSEQIEIYTKYGFRYAPTGLKHGTITVILDEPYEITSLRIDVETDGRHAEVEFTRDIEKDLSRRDFTINAMALSFDGKLIDPFGGLKDLEDRRVRFVGDSVERIREDYLRILRYYRFMGRYASFEDPAAKTAIRFEKGGLGQISVERIWSEFSKIISGPNGDKIVAIMANDGVLATIEFPIGYIPGIKFARDRGVTNAASIISYYLGCDRRIETLAKAWKWSNEDHSRAQFINSFHAYDLAGFKRLIVEGWPREWVIDLAKLYYESGVSELIDWEVPIMPVNGDDIVSLGFKPGPKIGTLLRIMKTDWINSDYTMTKKELIDRYV